MPPNTLNFSGFNFDEMARRKPAPTKPVGGPNFANYGGWVVSGETDPRMLGVTKWRTFAGMVTSNPIVATAMRYRLALAGKVDWNLEPPDDTPAAWEYTERAEAIFDDMRTPLKQVVQRASLFADLGFSLQTWRATPRPDGSVGLWGIRPIAQRTVERWHTDEVGDVLGVTQRSPHDNQERYIGRSRCIYLADTALNDTPEGLGLLRHCVESGRVLSVYQRLEGVGFQTDLAGIPIARAPLKRIADAILRGDEGYAGTTVAQHVAHLETFIKNKNKGPELGLLLDSEALRDIGPNQTPSGTHEWSLDVITAAASNLAALNTSIMREIKMIALVFGVEGLLLGMESTGAYALAKEKATQLVLVMESLIGQIRNALDRDVIDIVWLLNGWPEEMKPRFKTSPLQRKDVTEVMGVLEGLARAGATLAVGDPAINSARESVDLPPAPEFDPVAEGILGELRDPPDDFDEEDV